MRPTLPGWLNCWTDRRRRWLVDDKREDRTSPPLTRVTGVGRQQQQHWEQLWHQFQFHMSYLDYKRRKTQLQTENKVNVMTLGGIYQFIKVLSTSLVQIIYSRLYHIVEYIYITVLDYCIDLRQLPRSFYQLHQLITIFRGFINIKLSVQNFNNVKPSQATECDCTCIITSKLGDWLTVYSPLCGVLPVFSNEGQHIIMIVANNKHTSK